MIQASHAMRYRRKKSSPLPTIILWSGALAMAGWGFWQAAKIWQSVETPGNASSQPIAATDEAPVTAPADEARGFTIEGIAGTRDFLLDDPPGAPSPRGGGAAAAVRVEGSAMLSPVVGSLPGTPAWPVPGGDTLSLVPNPDILRRPTPEDLAPKFEPALTSEDLRAAAVHMLEMGEPVRARHALNAALRRTHDDLLEQTLRDMLRALNAPVFLGTAILPDDAAARMIEIQPGDSFTRLGSEYSLPAAFLEAINPSLNPRDLRPLKGVKVVEGPFHLRIIKRVSRVDLYAREMYVDSFSLTLPEGNLLPAGEYRLSAEGKIRVSGKTWIQFEGVDAATENVTSGWIYGSAGPRGTATKDRQTGVILADRDLSTLYNVLVERRSRVVVER